MTYIFITRKNIQNTHTDTLLEGSIAERDKTCALLLQHGMSYPRSSFLPLTHTHTRLFTTFLLNLLLKSPIL